MTLFLDSIETIQREPISTEVARTLLGYLLSGSLQPGDRLPSERQLAVELGVGRSVVREALKSLALLGLVDVRQGDGTYLRQIESDLPARRIEWGLLLGTKRTWDLVETRSFLEEAVAGLAATRRDESAIRDLHRHFADMERAVEHADAFVASDVAFHLRVAEASGNETLFQMMVSIGSLLHVWIKRVMHAASDYRPSLEEHRPVLTAIEAGNPLEARQAMSSHMERARVRLEATIPHDDRFSPANE